MDNIKMIINSEKLLKILSIYVFTIFLFDYSIVFKVATAILLILSLLVFKLKLVKLTPYLICELFFVSYILIHTLMFSKDVKISISATFTLIMNFFIAICTVRILSSEQRIEAIMRTAIVTSTIGSLYIILIDFNNIFSGSLGENVAKPFVGGIYSHNDIAGIAAISILFISYFECKYRNKIKGTIILKIFLLLFIILTGARKSLILALLGMFIYPTFFGENNKNILKKIIKVFIGCTMLIIFIYLIMNNSFLYNMIGNRFEGYFAGIENGKYTESSARTRSIMKESIIKLIYDKPIIGYGVHTFQKYKGSFGTWSHNNYLELWFSGGIIAVLLYYSYTMIALIRLLKKRKDPMGGMLLIFMIYMFIHDYLSVSYLSRFIVLMYCIVDSYLIITDENKIIKNVVMEEK